MKEEVRKNGPKLNRLVQVIFAPLHLLRPPHSRVADREETHEKRLAEEEQSFSPSHFSLTQNSRREKKRETPVNVKERKKEARVNVVHLICSIINHKMHIDSIQSQTHSSFSDQRRLLSPIRYDIRFIVMLSFFLSFPFSHHLLLLPYFLPFSPSFALSLSFEISFSFTFPFHTI